MRPLAQALADYLSAAEARAPRAGPRAVLAACDLIFARTLIGQPAFAMTDAITRHLSLLRSVQMAGALSNGRPRLSVHLTAYALASLALAGENHREAAAAFVADLDRDGARLIDPVTSLPIWPRRYSHHAWRVGHWVGGAPAIMRLVWRLAPQASAAQALPRPLPVLEACDRLVDQETGLLRTWRYRLIQSAFRRLYRLRHDPEAGDIGGVAHLHWINYAEGRPSLGAAALQAQAWRLMQRRPFIEASPYCLDFDVIQMVRTTATGPADAVVCKRASEYAAAIADYLAQIAPRSPLHRLPGALAALHECALLCNEPEVLGLGVPPIDIIQAAGWL